MVKSSDGKFGSSELRSWMKTRCRPFHWYICFSTLSSQHLSSHTRSVNPRPANKKITPGRPADC
jgi:hypothetical protein